MFMRAIDDTGSIAALARLGGLSAALRRRIVGWLYRLEHIVRKLLLAEAAALAVAARANPARAITAPRMALPTKLASAQAHASPPRTPRLDLDQPKNWPARFSFAIPRDPRAVPDSRAPRIRDPWAAFVPTPAPAPRASAARNAACFLLARRFEALRRVLSDPQRHIARLANILARAIHRFPELARRCILAPARTDDFDAADPRLSLEATARAIPPLEKLSDTS